jgi:type IV pilus assembly protein PilN
MIRINLLGIPKAKRGKRPAAAAVPGEGPSTGLIVLVFVALLGAFWWFGMKYVNNQHDKLEHDLQVANTENRRLAEVKAKYEANVKEVELFKQRVQVIEQLKSAQSGPVNLLNMVADTVNNTDAIWLDSMTDDGKSINFTGMALSPNAVADLMRNLQKTGAFKSVEFKETAQDSQMKELQAFKFQLICEKPAPSSPKADSKTEKKS